MNIILLNLSALDVVYDVDRQPKTANVSLVGRASELILTRD